MKTKIVKEQRKSIVLRVKGDVLEIKAPFHVSEQIINSFVESKQSWIEKQLIINQRQIISFDAPLYVLSNRIKLQFIKSSTKKIETSHDYWLVYDKTSELGIKQVRKHLKEILTSMIEYELIYLQSIKPFNYSGITIKNMTSRWGSCSSTGSLVFAFKLIHTTPAFIKSVIAHEVAHRFEMNHSKHFYHVLSQFDPNYHQVKKDPWGLYK